MPHRRRSLGVVEQQCLERRGGFERRALSTRLSAWTDQYNSSFTSLAGSAGFKGWVRNCLNFLER